MQRLQTTADPRRALRRLAALAAALLLSVGAGGCTVLQPVKDPVLKLLRRGSCIAVDIPPITLTPARTAAERQLIGEESEIEEDGWLIASAQSAQTYQARGDEIPRGAEPYRQETRRFYIEQGVLEFYREPVLRFRSEGVLGEGYDGLLRIVPESVAPRRDGFRWQEERETVERVAREVNRAREWLYAFERERALSEDGQTNVSDLEIELRTRYFRQAQQRSGEWIFTEERQWVRVR